MNSPEQTPESRPARERRVGTFTFGAVLVICGALMLVSMFFPSLDLTLALQLSPLIDPSVVTVRTIPARVECGGSFCRGMVVADRSSPWPSPA